MWRCVLLTHRRLHSSGFRILEYVRECTLTYIVQKAQLLAYRPRRKVLSMGTRSGLSKAGIRMVFVPRSLSKFCCWRKRLANIRPRRSRIFLCLRDTSSGDLDTGTCRICCLFGSSICDISLLCWSKSPCTSCRYTHWQLWKLKRKFFSCTITMKRFAFGDFTQNRHF